DFPLPPGTVVVSSDSHYTIWDDLWIEDTPPHLHDRLPRAWYDEKRGMWHMGIGGDPIYPEPLFDFVKSMDERPGFGRLEPRIQDLDAEGVSKEIVFPQGLPRYFNHPDFEARD